MKEECMMKTSLTLSKSLIDLLMHANIEAQNQNLIRLFNDTLNNLMDVQGEIYKVLKDKGVYKVEEVKEDKINKLIKKQSC